jgi:uncharacterized circularly permuted ATP-grasp superfamily protein
LNAESPTGIGYADALTELMRNDPIFAQTGPFQAFRSADAAYRALMATYSEWGGKGLPKMAIVDFLDVPTRQDFNLLAQSFERHSLECAILDPRDLRFEGGRLRGPTGPIDLVYRRVLVRDLLERSEECAALLAAYRSGAVCLVNSLHTSLLHSKGLFSLLHSGLLSDVLTNAEKAVVRDHVPTTVMLGAQDRVFRSRQVREMARSDRSNWVVKPVSESGGRGLVMGAHCSQEEWELLLETKESFVLQKKVPEWTRAFPDARRGYALEKCLIDLDPFLIRGRLAGFMCRLGRRSPLNVAQGAHLVPVFVSS